MREWISPVVSIELVTNIMLARLPAHFCHNLLIMQDWTRCHANVRQMIMKVDKTARPKPIEIGDMCYQYMLFRQATGTTHDLIASLTPQFQSAPEYRILFARQFVVQVYATLAILNARLGIQHNDLTDKNILYSAVAPAQQGKMIFYQLPNYPQCWVYSHFAPLRNNIVKLADFGVANVTFFEIDKTTGRKFFRKIDPVNDDTYEERDIAARFDLINVLEMLNSMLGIGELTDLINDARITLRNPQIIPNYEVRGAYLYDPELLILSHPFFAKNITCDMTPENIAALAADGNLIVPYTPLTSLELSVINP